MLKDKVLDSPKAMSEFLSRSRGENFFLEVPEIDDAASLLPTEPLSSLTPSDVVQTVLDSLRR